MVARAVFWAFAVKHFANDRLYRDGWDVGAVVAFDQQVPCSGEGVVRAIACDAHKHAAAMFTKFHQVEDFVKQR